MKVGRKRTSKYNYVFKRHPRNAVINILIVISYSRVYWVFAAFDFTYSFILHSQCRITVKTIYFDMILFVWIVQKKPKRKIELVNTGRSRLFVYFLYGWNSVLRHRLYASLTFGVSPTECACVDMVSRIVGRCVTIVCNTSRVSWQPQVLLHSATHFRFLFHTNHYFY